MNREQRSQRAKEHYKDVQSCLAAETKASIENTKIYGSDIAA